MTPLPRCDTAPFLGNHFTLFLLHATNDETTNLRWHASRLRCPSNVYNDTRRRRPRCELPLPTVLLSRHSREVVGEQACTRTRGHSRIERVLTLSGATALTYCDFEYPTFHSFGHGIYQ